ncbi:MAG: glutamate--tRNA ligase [Planctomycetota bacterium]
MAVPDASIVTRFAPSPTGNLHIGGARTALFCWALAGTLGGRFLLRIEDTDAARSSEDSARAILEDLAWLGIDWDEGPSFDAGDRTLGGDPRAVGPFHQSHRRDLYHQHLEALIAAGRAYPAFDTPAELGAMRTQAEAEKRTFIYRNRPADPAAAVERAKAEPHVVRFVAPDDAVVVVDEVLGEVRFEPAQLDDFVIRKADGMPTYHFACVVDDEAMGVTHVVRGQEHLMNAPRHVALQRALGFRTPTYAHVPLIFNDQGAKMSKRERDGAARQAAKQSGFDLGATPVAGLDAEVFARWLKDKKRQLEPDQLEALATALGIELPEVSVGEFRAGGYLPETINNFIALLGFTPSKLDDGSDRERFDMAFLVSDFDLARIGKSNARFDRKKLLSFNTDDVTGMEPSVFRERFEGWCARFMPEIMDRLTDAQRAVLVPAVQPQSKTFRDAADRCGFALIASGEIEHDPKAVKKWLAKNDNAGLGVLGELKGTLGAHTDWSAGALHDAVERFAGDREIGLGQVAQPLRVALTGTAVSPPIAETLATLGKDEALVRIGLCLVVCKPRVGSA